MDAVLLVRGLYEAYQARDFDLATRFLHPGAALDMPATAERLLGRDAIIGFQRDYPEPWGVMSVGRVLSDTEGASAEIGIVAPTGERFALAAFWSLHDELLHRGVEYWVTVGGELPPETRLASASTQAARKAWQERYRTY
jgi:hypothetical protein